MELLDDSDDEPAPERARTQMQTRDRPQDDTELKHDQSQGWSFGKEPEIVDLLDDGDDKSQQPTDRLQPDRFLQLDTALAQAPTQTRDRPVPTKEDILALMDDVDREHRLVDPNRELGRFYMCRKVLILLVLGGNRK